MLRGVLVVVSILASNALTAPAQSVPRTPPARDSGRQKPPPGSVSDSAALRIRGLGKRGAQSVPDLIRALSGPKPEIRRAAAAGLRTLGPSARSAIPGLMVLLVTDRDSVSYMADSALGQVTRTRPAPGVLRLIRAVRFEEGMERTEGASGLGYDLSSPIGAIALLTLLRDSTLDIRPLVRTSLRRSQATSRAFVLAALHDPSRTLRRQAALVLMEMH